MKFLFVALLLVSSVTLAENPPPGTGPQLPTGSQIPQGSGASQLPTGSQIPPGSGVQQPIPTGSQGGSLPADLGQFCAEAGGTYLNGSCYFPSGENCHPSDDGSFACYDADTQPVARCQITNSCL